MNWAEPDKKVSPVWATLLAKGAKNPNKFEEIMEKPQDAIVALTGKGLLDNIINPWIRGKMPNKWDFDLGKQKIMYNPTPNLNMFYKNKSDGFKTGLNWRF